MMSEIHYLNAIERRLREFQKSLSRRQRSGLGGEAFADELNWLSDYITSLERNKLVLEANKRVIIDYTNLARRAH